MCLYALQGTDRWMEIKYKGKKNNETNNTYIQLHQQQQQPQEHQQCVSWMLVIALVPDDVACAHGPTVSRLYLVTHDQRVYFFVRAERQTFHDLHVVCFAIARSEYYWE